MTWQDTTDWFPPRIKPVHVGYYQRDYGRDDLIELPDYWDGKRWLLCWGDDQPSLPTKTRKRWRGLRGPPA